jgi:UPF0716 family protein affecting phage T7 exclusion
MGTNFLSSPETPAFDLASEAVGYCFGHGPRLIAAGAMPGEHPLAQGSVVVAARLFVGFTAEVVGVDCFSPPLEQPAARTATATNATRRASITLSLTPAETSRFRRS